MKFNDNPPRTVAVPVEDETTGQRLARALSERAEVVLTIWMDLVMIVCGVVGRHLALMAINAFAAPGSRSFALDVIAFIADVGTIALVVIITGFDIAKRVRWRYRTWRSS